MKLLLLGCLLSAFILLVSATGGGDDGEGGEHRRGSRGNPRNRPSQMDEDGETLRHEGLPARVRLLTRGCGVALVRDHGDEEVDCETNRPRPGGSNGQGNNGQGDQGGDGQGGPTGDGEGGPTGDGQGGPTGDDNDGSCFSSRMSHPVTWHLSRMGPGQADTGAAIQDAEGCEPINFRQTQCTATVTDELVDIMDSGVMAKHGTLTASLGDTGGSVTVDVYLITNNGTIGEGDDERNVTEGMMKFTVTVDGYEMCQEAGALNVRLRLSSRCPPQQRNGRPGGNGDGGEQRGRPRRFGLCDGSEVSFSDIVRVGAADAEADQQLLMRPVNREDGNDQEFECAFPGRGPRFIYDPETSPDNVLYVDQEEDGGSSISSQECDEPCGASHVVMSLFSVITAVIIRYLL